jgi:hypothetical protein
MRDERVDKLADILTEYSIPMEAGQKAVIEGTTLAEPQAPSTWRLARPTRKRAG